jgi:hypothetical protein
MSQRQIKLTLADQLESVNAAGGSAGPSFRVGGRQTNVHVIVTPGALGQIQTSNDRVNWGIATDIVGNALTTLAAGTYHVLNPMEWIRYFIAQDASAPRYYDVVAHVVEDTE